MAEITSAEPGAFATSALSGSLCCPICRCEVTRCIPAEIAFFLRVRCRVPWTEQASANFCSHCEHLFFSPFLTSDQLTRLYTGHRGKQYDIERVFLEPGYVSLKAALDNRNSPYYVSRARIYDRLLYEFRDFTGTVVDFGGGDGFWTHHVFPAATTIVADASFERDGGDLQATLAQADIVFCAHVFEHLTTPRQILSDLVCHLRSGALVYIELPIEYEDSVSATFLRLENRMKEGHFEIVSPFQLEHEHVAHFSVRSMRMLAHFSGLNVEQTFLFDNGMAIWARKPNTPVSCNE